MRIQRDDVALAYDQAGQGEPTILLVHGWATDRAVLTPLGEALRGAHRVVTVDLRGFGASDAPPGRYTIDGYADDLAFLIDRLGLRRPLVIGHSLGGAVALALAAGHELAGAILLEAMVVAPHALAGLSGMLADVRGADPHGYVRGLLGYLAGPGLAPEARAHLLATVRAPQHVLVAALEGLIAFDSAAAAARVTCPLLYVGTGARYADLDRFRTLCPQLETATLAGCGHYFPLERPAALAAVVSDFIHTHVVARA